MKKNIPPKFTKKDFEKVFEHPLGWCPLLGYIPEKIDIKLKKRPVLIDKTGDGFEVTAYDLALEYIDDIKQARTYWNVSEKTYNLMKFESLPNIDTLTGAMKNKFHAARWIFLMLTSIAWGHKFIYDNILNDTPGQYARHFVSTRQWNNHKTDIFVMPAQGLLYAAQSEIDAVKDALNFDYTLSAHEVYAMFAIHEAWLMLIMLLKHELTQNDEDFILKAGDYIRKLLYAAEEQKEKKLLNEEIFYEVTTPWSPRKQSLRAKKKAEKEAKVLKPRNKAIEDKVADFLKDNNKDRRHISVQFVYDKIKRDFPAIIGELRIRQFENIAGYLIRDFKKRTKVSNKQ